MASWPPHRSRAALQFLRFLVVGVLNTAFGYAIFLALLWLGLAPGTALLLAWIAGVFFNYGTIRTLVFSGDRGRLLPFAAVYIGVFCINWLSLTLLQRAGAPAWAAQAALTLPMAVLSFAGQRLFVFSAATRAS